MQFQNKNIKTKFGIRKILTIQFETSDEFQKVSRKLSDEYEKLINNNSCVVTIGTFEEFWTAFCDHYSSRFNNTMFWESDMDLYGDLISKYLGYSQ